ncbi:hypothetical protein FKM82_030807 [Ascaphus truei]
MFKEFRGKRQKGDRSIVRKTGRVKLAVLSNGITVSCLEDGKVPEQREDLKMCVGVGIIVGPRGFRKWEGMRSREQVVEGEEAINSDTSSSETVEKESRKAGGEIERGVGWEEETEGMF